MITRVEVAHFKRFRSECFELADSIVLAGPNNSGKTTLLQVIATWKLGLDRWVAAHTGGKAEVRTGVALTRRDFTAVPLREMNLLWEDRRVSGKSRGTGGRKIEITLHGRAEERDWSCGIELQYAMPEMVHVRPRGAKELPREELQGFPDPRALALNVAHVPALSGIAHDEPRRDRGMQDLLIGQGKPGDVLRNLLLEVAESDRSAWQELGGHIRTLFEVELRPPRYAPMQPYIVCEYMEPDRSRPLDLSSAGSGVLQVLLVLAFIYARPASVLLLDEPDSHQHVILQREVYDLIRRVARERRAQLVVATHSEVVLDQTEPERVLGFLGDEPRRLAHAVDRDRLREALKRVTTTDLMLGRQVGAILYLAGESDERILREWARILGHRARRFLDRPFVNWLGGRGLKDAKAHMFALRAAFPDLPAVCLLDGDNRDEPDEEITRAGLAVLRWRRYEIENYLLHLDAIKRFVGAAGLGLFEREVEQELGRFVPAATDPLGDHPVLVRLKASTEILVPLLASVERPTPKRDLYLLAASMRPEEVHPEVVEKLDRIAEVLVPGAEGEP